MPQRCFRSGYVSAAITLRRRVRAEFHELLAAGRLGRTVLASFAALLLTTVFVLPVAGQTAASRHATPKHNPKRSHVSAFPDWPAGQLIYENGPINGQNTAWTINSGFIVSDSFTVTNNFTSISQLSFGEWLAPGTTLQSVEVSITSMPMGGTNYFDEMVGFSQIGCAATNQLGFNVCLVSGSIPGVLLNAGTYWVNLQNATTIPAGQQVLWDENSGVGCMSSGCPSQASENDIGTIPSEAFTLSGGSIIATTTSLSVTPSPAMAGQAVTLAATVQAQALPVQIGSVTFFSGTQNLGTVQVSTSAPGTATLLARFGPGSYSLTAQYNGNEFLQGSTSAAQPLTVTGTEPTTSILAASPNGNNYNFTLSVTGAGNSPLSGTGALENLTQNGLVIGSIPVPLPSTSTFQAVQSYAANAGPQGIAVGDFNGDGILDLAITNNSSTSISVLLGNADGSFQAAQLNDVGAAPVSVVAYDFNGDGILDLAVSNSQGVSILLGKGNGTFQPQTLVNLGAGTSPWGLAVADFNGDGFPDLAVTDANNADVRILVGNGTGTLTPQDTTFKVGTDPQGVAVGDFNGDGIPDLAVTNFGSPSGTDGLSILLGNGDGTFQTQVNYTTGKVPQGVAVGDFRGNGMLDLAVANLNDNTVGIFLGNGDGTFQSQATYPTGSMPYGVAVADFNGDGKQDLAVSNSDDPPNSTVTILLGGGDGTFQAQPNYTVAANPNGLVVGDFNGDGAPDVATADNGGNGATSVLLTETVNTGTLNDIPVYGTGVQMLQSTFTPDGTFYGGDTSNTVSVQGSGLAPTTTSVGGMPDPSTYLETVVFTATVTSSAGTPTGTVTFLDGSTPIAGCIDVDLAEGAGTCSTSTVPVGKNCITADYSGGGIFAASQSPCFTQTVTQAATTTTLTANPPSPSKYGEQVTFTATVIGANGGNPTGTVGFTANGNAIPGCSAVNLVPQTNGSTATCTTSTLAVGSYTIAGAYSGDTNFVASNGSIPYQVQSLTTATTLTVSPSSGGVGQVVTLAASVTIAAGPVNAGTVTFQNGQQVLGMVQVVASNGTATLKLRVPSGTYSFTASFNGTASFLPSQSSPTPYNGSGTEPTLSTLTATPDGSNYDFGLSVFGFGFPPLSGNATVENLTANGLVLGSIAVAGPGSLTFEPQQSYAAGGAPESVVMADFNGDGIPDLAITNSNDNTVSVLLGNGDGTFQAQQTYGTGSLPVGIVAWDFNGDGKLDLAVANEGNSRVSILLGNGDGTFQPQTSFLVAASASPFALVEGDFNHDGNADLAITDIGRDVVWIALGDGTGNFVVQATSYPTGGTEPEGMAVGDVNGDGNADLVVTNLESNSIAVMLGNGDGTFNVLTTMPSTAANPLGIAIADFNHDGLLDLAVADEGADQVGVFLGTGDGTFQPEQGYPTGTQPYAVVTADFNGDGNVDVAASNSARVSNSVSVLLGIGDGTFQAQQTYAVGTDPHGLAAGDLNGDGVPDLAAANNTSGSASILIGGTVSTGQLNNIQVCGIGDQNIQSDFTPNGTFYAGSLSNIVQVVGCGLVPTTTTLTSQPNPSTYLQPVTFTATVTAVGGGSPTGTVTFLSGKTQLCAPVTLGTGGIATCMTSVLSAGSEPVQACYSGDSKFQAGCGNDTQIVNPATVTVTLSSAPNPSQLNQAVVITAVVSSGGSGHPTGTVTFADTFNGVQSVLCQNVALNQSGTATCTVQTLAVGTHPQILATYSGDQNFAGTNQQISPPQVVTQPNADFTVLPISPSSVQVIQSFNSGNEPFFAQIINVTVQPLGGYGGTVSLSCSISPPLAGGSCTLVSPGGSLAKGNLNTTLIIGAGAATPVGPYTVTIKAQDVTGLTHTATLALSILNLAQQTKMPSGGVGGPVQTIYGGPPGTTIGGFSCTLVAGTGINGSEDLGVIGGSCSFNPTSTTIPNPVLVTLTGCTIAQLHSGVSFYASLGLGVPGIFLLGSFGKRSRLSKRLLRRIAMLLAIALVLLTVSCGAGTGPTTPSGSYLVLVQGTGSDGTVYSAVIPVTVQQIGQ